jgi:hypothetical protein
MTCSPPSHRSRLHNKTRKELHDGKQTDDF